MAGDVQYQMVTFHLGEELYGVNIMDVKEIVRLQNVRVIPNAPYYVEGIINLRGEIIPIIDLHKRFKIQAVSKSTEDIEMDGGFIILNIDGSKIGIIIDKVERVVYVKAEDVKDPPQMLSGIGNEYIEGVVREETGYLIMLNTRKLFNAKELQKIIDIQ